MADLMTAASPIEIQAKADEAGLPPSAREAALRLFHDLTSRIGLAALELARDDGEEWPRHRFYFGPEGGVLGALADVLRAQPEAAEVRPAPLATDDAPDTIYVTGSDAGFEAVLIASDNPLLLRAVIEPFEAQLRSGLLGGGAATGV